MDRVLRLVVIEGPVAERQAFPEWSGVEIAAFASPGADSVSLVERHAPDAVLIDLGPAEPDSATAVRRLVDSFPDLPAICLGTSMSPDDVTAAFEAGASAYIVKTPQLDRLGEAVRRVLELGSSAAAFGASAAHGVDERRRSDRRAGHERRTRGTAVVAVERRRGVDRRLSARRRNDSRLEPAT
jgi:DNA-binding NarL/FixJ family response regulator